MPRSPQTAAAREGFSMVEAVVAVAITSIAGGALLASLGGAVRSSSDAMHAAVARGLADQLMEEIAATRFPAGTNSTPIGVGRTGYDDIDDYDVWSAGPPVDRSGNTLGLDGLDATAQPATRPAALQAAAGFIAAFAREVDVERVEPDTGSSWNVVTQHTNFRRVTVRVKHTDGQSHTRTLVELIRIFSYVPVSP